MHADCRFCRVMHTKIVLGVFAGFLCSGIAGCVRDPSASDMPSAAALESEDYGSLERATAGAPFAVILYQTPTECLTCSTDLYSWMEIAREGGGVFLIVLTQAPTKNEVEVMRRMRLNFTILRDPLRGAPGVAPPAIAVFRGPDTLILEGQLTAPRRLELLDSARRLLQQK